MPAPPTPSASPFTPAARDRYEDAVLISGLISGLPTGTSQEALGTACTTGSGTTTTAWLAGDSQDTELIAINATTLTVTRRYFDPYGNSVGPSTSAFPIGDQGFIGGTADAATSLTNLGAREYQPATGSFISVDSQLTPFDPRDLDPYSYAEDDPVTNSDPAGTSVVGGTVSIANGSKTYAINNSGWAGTIEISYTITAENKGTLVNATIAPGGTSINVEMSNSGASTKATINLTGDEEEESAYSVVSEEEVTDGEES